MKNNSKKKLIKRTIQWCLGILLFYWAIMNAQWDALFDIEAEPSVTILYLFGWFVLTLTSRALQSLSLKIVFDTTGKRLQYSEHFAISWVRSFSNLFVPVSGLAILAGHLKIRGKYDSGEIIALMAPAIVLTPLITLLVGSVSLTFAPDYRAIGIVGVIIASTLTIMALLGAAFEIPFRLFIGEKSQVGQAIKKARTVARKFRKEARIIIYVTVLSALAAVLRLFRIVPLFIWLGSNSESISHYVAIGSVAEVVGLVQITPGAIGLREGSIIIAAKLLNVNPEIAAMVAIIDRVIGLALIGFAAAISYHWVSIKSSYNKPQ